MSKCHTEDGNDWEFRGWRGCHETECADGAGRKGPGDIHQFPEEAVGIPQEYVYPMLDHVKSINSTNTPPELRGLNGITTPLDRAASPAGGFSSNYQDDDLDVSYSRSAIQQSATLTSNDTAISQREREITDIAQGIIELADIFKELQTMVIDQGTMLDRIDFNVEQMNVHVKEADKELKIVSLRGSLDMEQKD